MFLLLCFHYKDKYKYVIVTLLVVISTICYGHDKIPTRQNMGINNYKLSRARNGFAFILNQTTKEGYLILRVRLTNLCMVCTNSNKEPAVMLCQTSL